MKLPVISKLEKDINFKKITPQKFINKDISRMNIRNSIISECIFENTDMHNCDLLGTKIYRSEFTNVNLKSADIFSLWFSECKFVNVDFSGAGIEDVTFANCYFENCIFNNVGLKKCNFDSSKLIGISPISSTFSLNSYKNCTISKSDFKGSFVYQIFENCNFQNVKMDISLFKYNYGIGNKEGIAFYSNENLFESIIPNKEQLVEDCLNENLFINAVFVTYNFESYINPCLALQSISAIEKMLYNDILLQDSELYFYKNLFHYFYLHNAIAPIVIYKMFEKIKEIYLNPINNIAFSKNKDMLYFVANGLYLDFNEFCNNLIDELNDIPRYKAPAYAWIHYEIEPKVALCNILGNNNSKLFKRISTKNGSFWEKIEIGQTGLEIIKIFVQLLGISAPIIYSEIKEKRKKRKKNISEKKDIKIEISFEAPNKNTNQLIQNTCNLLNEADIISEDMQGYNNLNIKELKIEYHAKVYK